MAATDPNAIADLLRCSGQDSVAPEQLRILREHAATLSPRDRVRLAHPSGDSIIEGPIDVLWKMLGRRPTRDEYLEMAVLAREAVAYCEKEASKVR